MSSIVAPQYRYKRPPRKRKAFAVEVPAIVTRTTKRLPAGEPGLHRQGVRLNQGGNLVLLRRDAVGLALVQSPTSGVNATTAAYIGVTGVDDLHEQCAARGARIVTGLADHPWGLRDFVVEMPGGHRLALGERITQLRLCRQEPGANRPNRSPIRARHRRAVTRGAFPSRTAAMRAAPEAWADYAG